MDGGSTLERDLIGSSVNLEESNRLDEHNYTQISGNMINNLNGEPTIFQLISVKSEYDGEMKVFVDGKSQSEFYIQKGVNQVPLYFEVYEQITTYFVLDYNYKGEECLTQNVNVKIV